MPILIKDMILAYYNCDTRKSWRWVVNRDEAVALFQQEANLTRNLMRSAPLPWQKHEIEMMLDAGYGHILGLVVRVTNEEPGFRLEET